MAPVVLNMPEETHYGVASFLSEYLKQTLSFLSLIFSKFSPSVCMCDSFSPATSFQE